METCQLDELLCILVVKVCFGAFQRSRDESVKVSHAEEAQIDISEDIEEGRRFYCVAVAKLDQFQTAGSHQSNFMMRGKATETIIKVRAEILVCGNVFKLIEQEHNVTATVVYLLECLV